MAGSESPLPGTEGEGERSGVDSLDTVGHAQQRCRPARHKDE